MSTCTSGGAGFAERAFSSERIRAKFKTGTVCNWPACITNTVGMARLICVCNISMPTNGYRMKLFLPKLLFFRFLRACWEIGIWFLGALQDLTPRISLGSFVHIWWVNKSDRWQSFLNLPTQKEQADLTHWAMRRRHPGRSERFAVNTHQKRKKRRKRKGKEGSSQKEIILKVFPTCHQKKNGNVTTQLVRYVNQNVVIPKERCCCDWWQETNRLR